MVQTLQRNQVEKMYFDIVFNLSLHHVGEFEPCQTQFNIFTLFLSPSWHLGPKISSCFAKNAGKLAGRPSKARRAHYSCSFLQKIFLEINYRLFSIEDIYLTHIKPLNIPP